MRILIATVTAGGGHLQAAVALEEAWRALRPRDAVQRVDVLDFTPRLFKKMYAEGYVKLVEHAPELYALLFQKTDNPAMLRKLTRLRRKLARAPTGEFVRYLNRFKPDAVLCPHFLPLEIIGNLKAKETKPAVAASVSEWKGRRPLAYARGYESGPPLSVSIVTDFEAHAFWMEPSVDLYCVAAEETKARLVARGVPPQRVVVTGIPVSTRFATKVDVDAVRERCGLRHDLATLLVLSGGFGLGPVAQILSELDKVRREMQVLVVCGRNEELRRELAAKDRQHPTRVLGFVTNMHELMAVADLIATKPGGLTSSEALAMGKPLVIINPIPGQEAANADFLLEHGAAIKLNRIEDLPFRLQRLIGSKKLIAMAKAAKALGRAGAAQAICREVLRRVEQGGK